MWKKRGEKSGGGRDIKRGGGGVKRWWMEMLAYERYWMNRRRRWLSFIPIIRSALAGSEVELLHKIERGLSWVERAERASLQAGCWLGPVSSVKGLRWRDMIWITIARRRDQEWVQ